MMVGLILVVSLALPQAAAAQADRTLCQVATDAVEKAAQRDGVRAVTECLPLSVRALPAVPKGFESVAPAVLRGGRTSITVRTGNSSPHPAQWNVPVSITLRAPAWRLKMAVDPGQPIGPSDLVLEEVVWPVGVPVAAATAAPPVGRAARALRAHQIVGPADVDASTLAFRGDRVRVLAVQGSIEVEREGTLLANTPVGQVGRAQLAGTRVVQGRLETPTLMRIESMGDM